MNAPSRNTLTPKTDIVTNSIWPRHHNPELITHQLSLLSESPKHSGFMNNSGSSDICHLMVPDKNLSSMRKEVPGMKYLSASFAVHENLVTASSRAMNMRQLRHNHDAVLHPCMQYCGRMTLRPASLVVVGFSLTLCLLSQLTHGRNDASQRAPCEGFVQNLRVCRADLRVNRGLEAPLLAQSRHPGTADLGHFLTPALTSTRKLTTRPPRQKQLCLSHGYHLDKGSCVRCGTKASDTRKHIVNQTLVS